MANSLTSYTAFAGCLVVVGSHVGLHLLQHILYARSSCCNKVRDLFTSAEFSMTPPKGYISNGSRPNVIGNIRSAIIGAFVFIYACEEIFLDFST